VASGTLPAGLTLAPSTGVISGTPTSAGSSTFTVKVTDGGSPAQTKSASTSITVAASTLSITASSLAAGTSSTAYSQTLSASGGTTPYAWSVASGTLPAGLTLAPSTGVISGTPTTAASSTFTVKVTDGGSPAQTKSASTSITVAATTLSITSSSLAAGTSSTAYSQTLSASGGTTPYTWAVTSGTLPAGLTLASSTGVISGTPTTAGSSTFTVSVTDGGSPAQTKSVSTSITVTASPLSISSSSLASGTNGTAYAQSLSATGGTPAYTWNYSGTLPAGLTLAATTGVISGTPTTTGTFSFTVRVTDNSTPSQSQSASTSIIVAAAATTPTGPGTTWYVRGDGGTRYSANTTTGQCDGKADAAYGGVGTNQHCAFNDYRFLYDDQSYGNRAWVIAGGDTVILRGGPWRVGFNQGISSNDKWCFGGSGPFDCSNPNVPAGTPTQHTRILGENYGSCNATNKTQIFGGFGVTVALNLNDAQYVDVSCVEITRHSDCIRHGVPAYPSGCSASFPLDDYDGDGITTTNRTHDLTLTDLWIHGHTDRGIIGPIGANVTCLRCNISYNGMAGWDFDDGRATVFGANASWNFLYSQISWNGCNQEYPITHTFPAISCYGQSSGGYGDGIGTPSGTGTGMTVVVDHSSFDHNTQDGIDLGHMDAGINALTFTNNSSYANSGGAVKWGAYFQTAVINNNLLEANCLRMSAPIAGAPSTYNTNLGDFCRAQDGVSFNLLQNATATFANNTIVSYAPTTMDIGCWDASCSNSTFTFVNNIMVGYNNPTTWNMGSQSSGPGAFYFQQPVGNIVRNNNLYYGVRNISCPTGNTGEICSSPLFVNQPTWIDETSLDNFNFNLTSGSPAKGTGVVLPFVTLDYNGLLRGITNSLGAIQ
jgi:hypothetical protein